MWVVFALCFICGTRGASWSSKCSDFLINYVPGTTCDLKTIWENCECDTSSTCLDHMNVMLAQHQEFPAVGSKITEIITECDFRSQDSTSRAQECLGLIDALKGTVAAMQGCPVKEIGESCNCDSAISCVESMKTIRALTPSPLIGAVNTIRIICEVENIPRKSLMRPPKSFFYLSNSIIRLRSGFLDSTLSPPPFPPSA